MTTPVISDLLPKSTRNRRYVARIRPGKWVEDNGRVWLGSRDKETGHPTGGALRLHPRFQPPYANLLPQVAAYFQFDPDDDTRVTIDYRQWRMDNGRANTAWREHVLKIAQSNKQVANSLEELPPFVFEIAGRRPMHDKFLAAMEAGNRWALGIPNKHGVLDPVPAWATPALLETLVRVETAEGSGTIQEFDPNEFANPDDDAWTAVALDETPDDLDDALARADEREPYEDLDDDHPPTPRTPMRSTKGQFTKRGP